MWAKSLGAAAAACLLGLGWFIFRRDTPASVPAKPPVGGANIVLIVLDTVRADHLSAYGYSRPTTNLASFADRGVVFENAVSPSSWTLPVDVSLFTGLLPHQHGANWAVPLYPGPRTLAEILDSHGYETAGFNANFAYGLAGWGIGRGFGLYDDDSLALRHNFAATLVGRALADPIYSRWVDPNSFNRRKAAEINRDVFRWFGRRQSGRPYFLFINYYDAHYPYFAPTPFQSRFAKVPEDVIRRAENFEFRGVVPAPLLQDTGLVIAAYDNCLAYLDDQVGQLIQFLSRLPDWKNTYVIITSDHGEALGEHKTYGHGINLYRETIHVPLIMVGPGVPAHRRIATLARLRDVFPTVLDVTLGRGQTPGISSLRRFWAPDFKLDPTDDVATSELIPMVSLTTSEWHYIHHVGGRFELYRLRTDPAEKTNLSDRAESRAILLQLRKTLAERIRLSFTPWRGPEYLLAVRWRGASPEEAARLGEFLPPNWLSIEGRGPATALSASSLSGKTTSEDNELLNSLPYH